MAAALRLEVSDLNDDYLQQQYNLRWSAGATSGIKIIWEKAGRQASQPADHCNSFIVR